MMKEHYKKDDLEVRMMWTEISSISFMINSNRFVLGWLKRSAEKIIKHIETLELHETIKEIIQIEKEKTVV